MNPVLAQSVRNGVLESWHRGTAVALRPDGTLAAAYGDVGAPVLPRSANKPLQAAGMLGLGLAELPALDDEMVAVAAASHSGEPAHLEVVRRLLAAAGLTEAHLDNIADFPLSESERRTYLREGRDRSRLAMNCSGKHAAMLATCVAMGEPVTSYRDPHSALQQGLRETVAELAGEPVASTTVDGCGAPMFAVSPRGLARAFTRLATAHPGTPEGRVAAAMRTYPDVVGGTGRDVTTLMRLLPGLVAKDGAEGIYAAALPDGGSAVVKLDGGAPAPRVPVMVALLRTLGADTDSLQPLATQPVLGGGIPVGELRATIGGPDDVAAC